MRAFIHAFRGRPWNKECCDAKDGFHKLGIETVMFTTNEEFDLRKPEDVVVGGTVIVLHALHQGGLFLIIMIIQKSLQSISEEIFVR